MDLDRCSFFPNNFWRTLGKTIGESPLGTRNRILLIKGGHFQVLLFGLSGGVKSEVLMMIKKVIRFYIACIPGPSKGCKMVPLQGVN